MRTEIFSSYFPLANCLPLVNNEEAKLFCWIPFHKNVTDLAYTVQETWAKRCDKYEFSIIYESLIIALCYLN